MFSVIMCIGMLVVCSGCYAAEQEGEDIPLKVFEAALNTALANGGPSTPKTSLVDPEEFSTVFHSLEKYILPLKGGGHCLATYTCNEGSERYSAVITRKGADGTLKRPEIDTQPSTFMAAREFALQQRAARASDEKQSDKQ